jgi:hypothetical protein
VIHSNEAQRNRARRAKQAARLDLARAEHAAHRQRPSTGSVAGRCDAHRDRMPGRSRHARRWRWLVAGDEAVMDIVKVARDGGMFNGRGIVLSKTNATPTTAPLAFLCYVRESVTMSGT